MLCSVSLPILPIAAMRCFRLFLLAFVFAFALPAAAHAQVDINQADAKALTNALVGVGLVKAEAIVAWRESHGPFRSVDDLSKVHGIGPKTIEANRAMIVVHRTAATSPSPG